MLILLFIAAVLLDTINSYLKLCIRRSVAHGYSPEMGLPLVFVGSGRLEWMFSITLLVGLALLCYGIYEFGFVAGIGCRMMPWIVGKVGARVLDSFVRD